MIIIEEYNFENNFHKQYGNLFLTDNQINILSKYNISYEQFNNMSELLYYLEDYLNNYSNEELDNLSAEIAEFNYYNNTNK